MQNFAPWRQEGAGGRDNHKKRPRGEKMSKYLVVRSNIKDYAKVNDRALNVSTDFYAKLNEAIVELIKKGVPINPKDLVLKANFGILIVELERLRGVDLENELFDINNVNKLREQINNLAQIKLGENGGQQTEQSTTK